MVSREKLRQACSWGQDLARFGHEGTQFIPGGLGVPDSGVEEVISSGTGEQGLEGEAVVQQLVVDPQKEIKLQINVSRDRGTSSVLSPKC